MDRRTFLALGAASAGAAVTGAGAAVAAPPAVPPATRAPAGLLWAANFASASDSYGAGFGNVQVQDGGGPIRNNGPGIPVVPHDSLGRTLRIALKENQMRWEARPGAATSCKEGDDLYFRVDFSLAYDFPVSQPDPFCLINQIHQGSDSGSPPVEFDIVKNTLSVRGASTAYNRTLVPVKVSTVYKLVYRVRFSYSVNNSLLEVWVNDQQVLSGFKPPCATMNGGNSYWKGATMYCRPSISPVVVYQNAHRVGTTRESVSA